MPRHDMDDRLDEWVDAFEDDIIVSSEAEKFIAYMDESHPGVVTDWLRTRAPHIIHDAISARLTKRRSTLQRRNRKSAIFAREATRLDEGEITAEEFVQKVGSPLDAFYAVAEDHRKRLRDMTAEDIDFAASDYERRAESNAFEAAYLRALGKRLEPGHGGDCVQSRFFLY